MKRFLTTLTVVLIHTSLIEAFILLTLFVTDRFNRAMGFLTAEISKWLLFAFCITVILLVILLLWHQYRKKD
ncbi:MAG: hypothetical protein J6C26_08145 [Clostridia bacterium]|nr:hypothetical protein [Clostridia bacterium]MBQ4323887.1 hypothetical protein [Clostridia bacterium]